MLTNCLRSSQALFRGTFQKSVKKLVSLKASNVQLMLNVLSLTLFVAMSWDAPKVRLYPYFKQISPDQTLCVAIGAMAKGQDDFADSYVEEKIGK